MEEFREEIKEAIWAGKHYGLNPHITEGWAKQRTIVECTDETFERAGLDEEDEAATIAFCEELFAEELEGHRLVGNKSIWRRVPTVKNERWHHGNRFTLMFLK